MENRIDALNGKVDKLNVIFSGKNLPDYLTGQLKAFDDIIGTVKKFTEDMIVAHDNLGIKIAYTKVMIDVTDCVIDNVEKVVDSALREYV